MNTPAVRYAQTPLLSVAYEEQGDPHAPPLVLVHGFPDDARTWDALVAAVPASRFRLLAPYLRGHGPTRFLRPDTPRNGHGLALAQDILDFADALGLADFLLVGHDLGADAALIAATLQPGRVRGLVLLAPDFSFLRAEEPLPLDQARAYWYAWYLSTERGKKAFEADQRTFCRQLWRLWSPGWTFDEATFQRTARSFDNPDFVEVVLHGYRHSAANVPADPGYDEAQRRLAAVASVAVPTVVLHGAADGATLPPASLGKRDFFTSTYRRQVLPQVGHFVQRESPGEVVAALLSVA